jgi:hypothetical protein
LKTGALRRPIEKVAENPVPIATDGARRAGFDFLEQGFHAGTKRMSRVIPGSRRGLSGKQVYRTNPDIQKGAVLLRTIEARGKARLMEEAVELIDGVGVVVPALPRHLRRIEADEDQ